MSEDQIPIAVFLSALSGAAIGVLVRRTPLVRALALVITVAVNAIVWMTYGYIVNFGEGVSFTFIQMLAGAALALPGLALYLGLAALAGFAIVAIFGRRARRQSSEATSLTNSGHDH